jgi:transposase
VDQLSTDMRDASCPPEVRQLGRTMRRWRTQIAAWHEAQVTNGPTETMIIGSPDRGVVDVVDEAA